LTTRKLGGIPFARFSMGMGPSASSPDSLSHLPDHIVHAGVLLCVHQNQQSEQMPSNSFPLPSEIF
jgi:hypothetical protein